MTDRQVDTFALWLMTRDPVIVEQERFGKVDILGNMFGTRQHKEMIKNHEARKQLWYYGNSDNAGNGVSQKSKKQLKVKMTPESLAMIRAYIERHRNGQH